MDRERSTLREFCTIDPPVGHIGKARVLCLSPTRVYLESLTQGQLVNSRCVTRANQLKTRAVDSSNQAGAVKSGARVTCFVDV